MLNNFNAAFSKDIAANDYVNMPHFNDNNTSPKSFPKMVKLTRQIDSTTIEPTVNIIFV